MYRHIHDIQRFLSNKFNSYMSALATTKSALAPDLNLSQLEPPIYVWSLLN